MRVTTSQLRLLIVNPHKFVANARIPSGADTAFGNPQRRWMEAAWRAYFREGRDPKVLWREFHQKVSAASPSTRRNALAANAIPMLEQFLASEQDETKVPADCLPPARNVLWEEHILAIQRHLVYLTEGGYRLRQLWTDRLLPLDHVDADLMAVAVLICADADLGAGRTESVEVWHLRDGNRQLWSRDELLHEANRLKRHLDDVATELV
jgi:hypothetical protein